MINFDKTPLFLAPLAGLSDPPLRFLAKKFGCDVTISEMISANALVFKNQKTLDMLKNSPFERPFIAQIEGSDENIIKKAVEIINKFDAVDGIDLNCGCPVPKVIKQNAGSALLRNLDLFEKLIATIKKHSKKQYTSVKIRLGFDEKIPEILAKKAENGGADFIAIHGRTRSGGYSSIVDYEAIRAAKNAVKIPIIANGDISIKNYKEVLKITNANGLMIGRNAIGKPWIFKTIKDDFNPTINEIKNMVLEHLGLMLKEYPNNAIALFRKHLHEYSKGFEGASEFRKNINEINDKKELIKKIEEFFI